MLRIKLQKKTIPVLLKCSKKTPFTSLKVGLFTRENGKIIFGKATGSRYGQMEQSMKAIGTTIKLMEKELSTISTVIFLLDSGSMTRAMEMELTSIKMALDTKATGQMMSRTATEKKLGSMGASSLGSIKMV
jgi:hypothetical protein